MQKININLDNKLAIFNDGRSRLLLSCAHLLLVVNILGMFVGVLPVIGIFLAFLFVIAEQKRKNVLAKDAVKFVYARLILNSVLIIMAIFAADIYLLINNVEEPLSAIGVKSIWWGIGFVLLPLNIHDVYCMSKGKLGFRFKEFIGSLSYMHNKKVSY